MGSVVGLRLLVCAVVLAITTVAAPAQDFPSRVVKIIVPYAAGGELDIMARAVAKGLQEKWKQSVIVENRTGAGSIIGTEAVAGAPSDGYTILFTSFGFVTSQALRQKLPYDPAALNPLVVVANAPLVLYVNAKLPVSNLKDLLEYGKKQPISFGSSGNLSSPHLAAVLFSVASGAPIQHVPYRGIAPAVADVVGGHINAVWAGLNQMPHVKDGNLRWIIAASEQRLIRAPEIVTAAENGLPALAISSWYGLFLHSQTPPAIHQKIYADLKEVVASPEVQAQIAQLNLEPSRMEGAAFRSFLDAEVVKWKKIIADQNLSE